LEGTETSGGSTLTYSPDQYHYNWKTEKAWEGTCRVLVIKLNDSTEHTAVFKFK
ncbi:MAG: PxKF domain-containing protein, partial [Acidobacteria bacterium]|nr:PxKF domain-containing protein [Acidobacteriota bacterium]